MGPRRAGHHADALYDSAGSRVVKLSARGFSLTLTTPRESECAAQRTHVERVQRKRYKNNPAQLGAAQQALAAHTQAGTLSASAQILALCRQENNRAWLAALPRGEGSAVDALEQLTRAFSRSVHANDGGTLRDALDAPGLGALLECDTDRGVLDFVVDHLATGESSLHGLYGPARAALTRTR